MWQANRPGRVKRWNRAIRAASEKLAAKARAARLMYLARTCGSLDVLVGDGFQ